MKTVTGPRQDIWWVFYRYSLGISRIGVFYNYVNHLLKYE